MPVAVAQLCLVRPMRTALIACLIVATSTALSLAGEVRVFIAPRSPLLPNSGTIRMDVYWINRSDTAAAIPAMDRYWLNYSSLPRRSSALPSGGSIGSFVDHASADRRIAPWAIIRDEISVHFDAARDDVLEISGEFIGRRKKFHSNTILLTKTR